MDDKKPLPGKGRGAKKRKPNVGKQASRLRNENTHLDGTETASTAFAYPNIRQKAGLS